MARKVFFITARDAVHNFTRYAALVDGGAEVIITRGGRSPLKLVRVELALTPADRKALVESALSIRATKPFKGKFVRHEAYES